MQFEKGGRGLLREAFRNEGESVGGGKSDGEKMKLFKKRLSADRRIYRWMVWWVGGWLVKPGFRNCFAKSKTL